MRSVWGLMQEDRRLAAAKEAVEQEAATAKASQAEAQKVCPCHSSFMSSHS